MNAQEILEQTAAVRGLSAEQVTARGRSKSAVHARIETAVRLHNELGMNGSEMEFILKRSEWICRYYYSVQMRERRNKQKLQNYHRASRLFPQSEWCKTFGLWTYHMGRE